MQRKIFLLVFIVLDCTAGIILPFEWALLASLPLVFVSWWLAYRSGLIG